MKLNVGKKIVYAGRITFLLVIIGLFPLKSFAGDTPFLGEITIFAGNFPPRGWAFCEGQLLPIAQNTALFSLVGTTYGGDGRTTLGLPNMAGRLPMHPGNGPGLTSRRLGEKAGTETATLSESQMPNRSNTRRWHNYCKSVSNTLKRQSWIKQKH